MTILRKKSLGRCAISCAAAAQMSSSEAPASHSSETRTVAPRVTAVRRFPPHGKNKISIVLRPEAGRKSVSDSPELLSLGAGGMHRDPAAGGGFNLPKRLRVSAFKP